MKDIIKNILSIIKYIIMIIIVLVVAIILIQRVSNNNMSLAGYRIFTVITESMVPKYNVGDVLLVKYTEPSEIKIEDDVTYMGRVGSFADKIVTHQVIDIKQQSNGTLEFVTKGIANNDEDPIVGESQIYGVVQRKLDLMSKLNGIINNMYGMYFLIIIPLAFIVLNEIKGYKEEKKEALKESEEEDTEDSVRSSMAQRRKKRRARRRKRNEKEKE